MGRATEETMIERGSGNVFADLGLPDADELLAKSKLVRAISAAIKERKVTQTELAKLTGISQSKISRRKADVGRAALNHVERFAFG